MADAASSFSYEPLQIEQVRWYWNKQPFNLKGVSPHVRLRCDHQGPPQTACSLQLCTSWTCSHGRSSLDTVKKTPTPLSTNTGIYTTKLPL